ncbi:uncharacterized protein LOC107410918 [Ziziphus jujuba]|uniref:Uncharacterized protein LOC107410918 n=1 Tax=Ziziphus jujuba TaxID=326968 RepID=A0A6P3ZJV8_ZIZJJ|nr:uncharacterized protein LOC107410918 [Ziziphus jujuba]XP_048324306.2 uncharacterized protein LOC107410918 [Ziziphus jujuba]
MEGQKKGSSSSSFTADLFGAKEYSPPQQSTGLFASIFPPPSKVVGRNSASSELLGSWQKQAPRNQAWNIRQGHSAIRSEDACRSIPNKDRSSVLHEERVEPCNLSSSIYYGGQDIYSQSQSTQISGSSPIFKKDEGEDDPNASNSASRGNWWQGSLYY